jgi:hypothetical protein
MGVRKREFDRGKRASGARPQNQNAGGPVA